MTRNYSTLTVPWGYWQTTSGRDVTALHMVWYRLSMCYDCLTSHSHMHTHSCNCIGRWQVWHRPPPRTLHGECFLQLHRQRNIHPAGSGEYVAPHPFPPQVYSGCWLWSSSWVSSSYIIVHFKWTVYLSFFLSTAEREGGPPKYTALLDDIEAELAGG